MNKMRGRLDKCTGVGVENAVRRTLEKVNAGVPEKAARKGAPEQAKTRGQALFSGENNPKKMRKIVTLEQWVEVEVENGKTVTRLFPSNEELIEEGKGMYPPPDLVYRRFNFPNGVPQEYHWAQRDPEKQKYGGAGIQRMTVDTWLDMVDLEKERADGHVGPTPAGNLPRPKERGGCECPVCSGNQEILDRRTAGRAK